MKELSKIVWALEKVKNALLNMGDEFNAKDIDWCIGMVNDHECYCSGWSQYSIVKAFQYMAQKYFDALMQAVVNENDPVMRKNWHQMADNWCRDMKEISILL